MTKDEARVQLVRTLHEAAGILADGRFSARLKDPTADVTLEEMEIDSLGVVDWQLKIEEATGVEIDPGLIMGFGSINALAEHVAQQTANDG